LHAAARAVTARAGRAAGRAADRATVTTMGDLGWVIPTAGALQWVSGIVLALAALRRGWRYAGAGVAPRTLARLAVFLFAVAALELIVALVTPRDLIRRLGFEAYATQPWQLRTVLLLCIAGWLLLLLAASWNGILGVNMRRRTAAEELKRRSERARTSEGRAPGA